MGHVPVGLLYKQNVASGLRTKIFAKPSIFMDALSELVLISRC